VNAKSDHRFLLLTVFISGMTTMAVEMSASRLLDPYFGNSLLIWTALIGLVLIYLTVGYYLGGKIADRSPHYSTLFQITAWAAFLIGVIPVVSRPILRFAVVGFAEYSVGILLGSLLSILLLFAAPVTLLGCVSPFAIRLAMRDVNSAGHTAGGIYALSTLGSIIGTFSPVLLFIPNIGTRRTFVLFAITLLALSLVGLWRARSRRARPYAVLLLILVLLSVLTPVGVIKASPGMIYETESAHNYIQVIQEGDTFYLLLNEGEGVHSMYTPGHVLYYGIWDLFLIAPFLNNPPFTAEQVQSLCLIGLAGGTIAKQYTAIYGPIPIDGVELDPEIIEVGRRYFDMTEPNLNAIAQDGRYFLAHSSKHYDVVAVDAYRPPYIPFHLTTREFFQEVYAHLTDTGVLAINVGRSKTDYGLVNVLSSTAQSVFPDVYIIDAPDYGSDLGNSLVVATKQPTQAQNLTANARLLDNPHLQEIMELALPAVRPFEGAGPIFTDDKAPVEQVVHGLIVKYVMGLK